MMEELLTIEELSKLIKVSKSTIYRWTHEKYIPHVKIGGLVRFDPKEIKKWLDKRKIAGRIRRYPEITI